MTAKKEYSTKVLSLSTAQSKNAVSGLSNYEQRIRSIKILNSTLSTAIVKVWFPDTGEDIELKVGVPYNFSTARKKAVLYWDAQSGAEVTIGFSENEHFAVGPLSIESIDTVYTSDGSYSGNSLVTVNTTASAVLSALANAAKRTFENIGSVPIYVGDQASCADSNYKNLCEVLYTGDKVNWNSPSALYARTESATSTDGGRVKTFTRTT
jgi:hypothetical protein